MITDNVIIAFEVIHYLKNLRGGRNVQMAAKLDMSKAYDKVEWDYLKAILLKLGFHARWVMLIMECVSSATYSVLVNGEPTGYIKPSRGLRQGDPLSPYLFLICAEGLSALIRKAKHDRLIHGVAISRGGPRISHFLLLMIALFSVELQILVVRLCIIYCYYMRRRLGRKLMVRRQLYFLARILLKKQD